jgi:hypothetical protein
MQKFDITGIIMPHNWSEDGKVIQLAIYTNKEEVYLVEHNRLAQELIKHINKKVKIKGKKSERLDGKNYIGVQNYFILEEIANGKSNPAPLPKIPASRCEPD